MLEKIKIQKCATYDEVGCTIEPLNKINFIYGANGTGKTTISNYIKSPNAEYYSNCQLKWQNITIDTLVYNKNFRDENFSTGKINGVFTLGQATKEDIELINTKIDIRTKNIEEGKQKKDTLDKQLNKKTDLEDKFKEEVWIKLYKKNEKNFKDALRGSIGSKEAFKTKILSEFSPIAQAVLPLEELVKKSETLFSETLPTAIEIIQNLSNVGMQEIEINDIWSKIIVGKADVEITKLIHRLKIDDWVNEGRNYLEEQTCPFCQQKTITESFIKQLESYFDETYLKELEKIKTLKDNYYTISSNVINISEQIESTQKGFPNSKLNIELFTSYLKTLTQQFRNNQSTFDDKLKEPSRKFLTVNTQTQIEEINKLIFEANQEIKKHNNLVLNYEKEKESLIKEVWKYLIEEFRVEITEFRKESDGLQKGIQVLQEQVKLKREEFVNLDSEIKELSKNITDIQPTIDEINKLLKYYGFLNFQIVKAKEDGFYQIKRQDGTFAHHTLSEGEITFITFLYFLQLAKGAINKENITNERILVIDDPISSLDSNILFVVSTLIKNIINDIKEDKGSIKQLIILTHNVYFHKEVSFIDARTDKSNKVNFWILRKNGIHTAVQRYGMQNPIQSSYSLLWQEFKNEAITSTVSIQNIMRRIIENYFKLLGKYGDDKLINKFETKEEKEICKSLLSWVNDGSHSIHDDLYIEVPTQTIETYKRVFKDVFEKTNHLAHYNMMMEIED